MIVVTYVLFIFLSAIAAGVQYVASKHKREPNIGNNPHFVAFLRSYLIPYYPALLADWLQGMIANTHSSIAFGIFSSMYHFVNRIMLIVYAYLFVAEGWGIAW